MWPFIALASFVAYEAYKFLHPSTMTVTPGRLYSAQVKTNGPVTDPNLILGDLSAMGMTAVQGISPDPVDHTKYTLLLKTSVAVLTSLPMNSFFAPTNRTSIVKMADIGASS